MFSIGDKISLGNYTLEILKIDSFSGTKHYGVVYVHADGYCGGWIPANLLEEIGTKK